MSEQLHAPKTESLPKHESHESSNEHLNKLKEQAERDKQEHNAEGRVDDLAKKAETQAISAKEMSHSETAGDNAPASNYINRELKDMAFRRSLNSARRHMSAPARALSKVIHQPVIEKVSDAAGSTVARPSGILGGGIFAFVGSALLLWVTKRYGYEYNYLVFFMLFVAGFAVGMIVELVVRALLRNRHKNN